MVVVDQINVFSKKHPKGTIPYILRFQSGGTDQPVMLIHNGLNGFLYRNFKIIEFACYVSFLNFPNCYFDFFLIDQT